MIVLHCQCVAMQTHGVTHVRFSTGRYWSHLAARLSVTAEAVNVYLGLEWLVPETCDVVWPLLLAFGAGVVSSQR